MKFPLALQLLQLRISLIGIRDNKISGSLELKNSFIGRLKYHSNEIFLEGPV